MFVLYLEITSGEQFFFFNSKRENEFWNPHSSLWGKVNAEAFVLILIDNPIKPLQKHMLSLFYWSAKVLLIPPLKLRCLLLTRNMERRCRARGCQILDTMMKMQPEWRSADSADGAPSGFFFFPHQQMLCPDIVFLNSFWCGRPACTTNQDMALHTERSCAFIHHLPWTCTNESIL